jgi:hypothetical protein
MTDVELEDLFKAKRGESHIAGLRAVYEAGFKAGYHLSAPRPIPAPEPAPEPDPPKRMLHAAKKR